MKVTLAVLLAWWTIYCKGTVLSVPPSLIVDATSWRRQQLQPSAIAARLAEDVESQTPWKKDAAMLPLAANEAAAEGSDYIRRFPSRAAINYNPNYNSAESNNNKSNYAQQHYSRKRAATSATTAAEAAKVAHKQQLALQRDLADAYVLGPLLAAARGAGAVDAPTNTHADAGAEAAAEAWQSAQLPPQEIPDRNRAASPPQSSQLLAPPLKYWSRHCEPSGRNCPQQNYGTLYANRARQSGDIVNMDYAAADVGSADEDVAVGDDDDDDDDAGDDAVNSLEIPDNEGMLRARVWPFEAAASDAVEAAADNDDEDDNDNDDDVDYDSNDIFMLLTGEHELIKFLHWAMEKLYPYRKLANFSALDADYNYPGMYSWKKLNLSGRLEPPLLVEEPRYILVRREKMPEDLKIGARYKDDPFIPPRGRKHNSLDLDLLQNRFETFVPNRGRRDNIKDIFKYDDVFFPNRGKKREQQLPQPPPPSQTPVPSATRLWHAAEAATTTGMENYQQRGKANEIVAPHGSLEMRGTLAKLRRKLQQAQKYCLQHVAGRLYRVDCSNTGYGHYDNNNSGEWPRQMTTYKINSYDQSEELPAMPAAAAASSHRPQWRTFFRSIDNERQRRAAGHFTGVGAAVAAANRLQSTRSMSAMAQRQRQRLLQQQQFYS